MKKLASFVITATALVFILIGCANNDKLIPTGNDNYQQKDEGELIGGEGTELIPPGNDNNQQEDEERSIGGEGTERSLAGTSWKLIGIIEVDIGLLNELEPKNCERCYTIAFDTDTVHYFSSSNTAIGPYNIDYVTCSISIPNHILTTKVGEWGDGILWVETLPKIEKFALQKDVLKLYYRNGKSYFLFKPLNKGVVYD